MTPWVGALAAFVAVASATVAVVLGIESIRLWRRRSDIRSRVNQLLDQQEGVEKDRGELFRAHDDRAPSVLEVVLARYPRFANLPLFLENSGLGWSVHAFLMYTGGAALAGFVAALLITGSVVLSLIAAALMSWLPYTLVKSRTKRRLDRFEEVFPDALDMLGRAIRAGHPLTAGIQMVGQEVQEPVADEFRRLFEEQRFGVPFADALMGMVDRVDLVDVRIFATAVLVQREVGGNLAEILDNITSMVRDRFRIRRQLRTFTAQGRMSGIIIGTMPFVVVGAISLLNRDYVVTLWEHPLGRMMVASAIVFQIIGYLWIRKIVNIEI